MDKTQPTAQESVKQLALDQIDSDVRKDQTKLLLEEFLPHLAADIENSLYDQEATVFYEIFSANESAKIRVVLKLKKLDHEVLIHLNSGNAMFVVGSERGGETATNALNASGLVRTILMRVRSN